MNILKNRHFYNFDKNTVQEIIQVLDSKNKVIENFVNDYQVFLSLISP
jgi:hypothetical protein